MSDARSITRRSVIAALGAGGLGFGATSKLLASPPAYEHGMAGGSAQVDLHPLTGLWLAMVKLPSSPDLTIAVPSIFGPDGLALLMFPVTEPNGNDIHLRGPAIGTWEPINGMKGHFTVVQTISDMNGRYAGSVTIDGYPSVSLDGLHFEENIEESVMTIRDAGNLVQSILHGGPTEAMSARKMSPGHAGFPDGQRALDPRTP